MAENKSERTTVEIFRQEEVTLGSASSYQPDPSLLSSLLHSLPLNIYAKDLDGRFLFANEFYCQSTGKSYRDIIGKNDYQIHPADLADKYLADDARVIASRKTVSIEEEWQSIGGKRHYTKVIKTPLYNSETPGKVIGTLGMFWDISERKETEIALAEERNLLRTLIDVIPNFVYVKDTKSRFLLANKAVAEVMGAAHPDELIGKSDFDFYAPEEANKFFQDELRVLQEDQTFMDIEETLHDPQGVERWSLTTKLPLHNIEGKTVGLVGIGHDISERKRLENQLLHSQKMETIGTLTAGIAHDFNNLLNVINGYSEILLLDDALTGQHRDALSKVLQAGKSASELISQLMAFSRKQVIRPQVLDFNLLLQNTQVMLRRVIGEMISFEMSLTARLWNIKADPNQLEQMIVNLTTNARDAMPDGGTLRFVTSNVVVDRLGTGRLYDIEPGEYICLAMTDDGCGIPKGQLRKIFEPFFTTKPKHKGTGLGLATVLGIVQQNGGGIELASTQGKGTTICIYLPRCKEQLTSPADQELIHLPKGTETILVAEDELNVRSLVSDILSRNGYTVHTAASGEEALRLSQNQEVTDISLLLSDVVMPGIGGRELADAFLRQQPSIKVLFMSGYADDQLASFDLQQPGIGFIPKPFTPHELLRMIRNLLDG